MSAANGSAVPGEIVTNAKGKGKAVEQSHSHDMSMDEDEDSSEGEESANEEPVSYIPSHLSSPALSLYPSPFHITSPSFRILPALTLTDSSTKQAVEGINAPRQESLQ
jgi:hypothetical protein